MRLSALLPLAFLLVNVSASGEGGRYSLSDDSSGRTHSSDADKHYHRFTERVPDRYSSNHRSHHSYSGVTGVYTGYTSKDDNFGSTIGRDKGEEVSSKPPPKRRSLYEPFAPAPSLIRRSPIPSGREADDTPIFNFHRRLDGVRDTRSGNDGQHASHAGSSYYFSGVESDASSPDPPTGRTPPTGPRQSPPPEALRRTHGTTYGYQRPPAQPRREHGHTLGAENGEEVDSWSGKGKSSGLYRRASNNVESEMSSRLTEHRPPPSSNKRLDRIVSDAGSTKARWEDSRLDDSSDEGDSHARRTTYGHTVGKGSGTDVTSKRRPSNRE